MSENNLLANSPRHAVIGFGAFLVSSVIAASALFLFARYNDALEDTRRTTQKLAVILSEETSRSFQNADLVLRNLIDRIGLNDATNSETYATKAKNFNVHQLLLDSITGIRQLDAVTIVDANGALINTSRSWPVPHINLADRDYFLALKSDPKLSVFVSSPVQNRGTGTWTIYLARRIMSPNGDFLGLMLGAFELNYFTQLYGRMAFDQGQSIALLRNDGLVLIRYPQVEEKIGLPLVQSDLIEALTTQSATTLETHSPFYGERRIFSARALSNFPLIVSVGWSRYWVLGPWRQMAFVLGSSTALISLVLILFIFLFVRQLHRRELSENALWISEKRFAEKSTILEVTLENMSQGIIMIDKNRCVAVANKRASELLDLPEELLHSKPYFENLLAYQWQQGEFGINGEKLDNRLRRFIRSGGMADDVSDYIRERANGTILEIRSIPLPDGGLVRTYSDITQQKRIEQELREARIAADHAVQVKSEFLATMSHEIRSPMHGVLGLIELLGDTKLDPDQRHMTNMIHDSASVLLGVLNDVLDFSKIEAQAMKISLEPISLQKLIPSFIAPFLLTAAQKGLKLTTNLADNLPPWLALDPLRVRQILTNLIGNALKFTPKGEVNLIISLTVDEYEPETRHIRFVVTDTGIGIAPEVIGQLFEPFSQADGSTTRHFGGTGLGLSISRRLARLMNGDLAASSSDGEGSRFEMYLPLIETDPPSSHLEQAFSSEDWIDKNEISILVADDDSINCWLISRQLTQLGLKADIVKTGQEALEALKAKAYSLVITDFHMPGMDGIDLAREIRKTEIQDGKTLPIIALTADITPENAARGREAGINIILTKPANLQQLDQAVRSQLMPDQYLPKEIKPTPSSKETSVFDMSGYRELFDNNNEEGVRWLEDYLATATSLVESVRHHAQNKNFKELATDAHRLAGNSLSVGALRLGTMCQDLESAARQMDQKRISDLIDLTKNAYIEVTDTINTMRATHDQSS